MARRRRGGQRRAEVEWCRKGCNGDGVPRAALEMAATAPTGGDGGDRWRSVKGGEEGGGFWRHLQSASVVRSGGVVALA